MGKNGNHRRNTKILHPPGPIMFTPAALYRFTSLCTQIAEPITITPAIIAGRNKDIKPENKFIILLLIIKYFAFDLLTPFYTETS